MKKNKTFGFIRIDSMIDIITNSSSELFVIENKMAVPMLVEMVNEALCGSGFSISESSVELRKVKELSEYESDWEIDRALEMFPEAIRDELREKYFTEPNYYGIAFDRDEIWSSDKDVRDILKNIGFELIDSDY